MYTHFARFWDLIALENFEVTEKYLAYVKKHRHELSSILELGCGSGFNLRRIKLLGDFELTGVDSAPEMISIAKAEVKKVKFIEDDMTTFQTKKKFDLILSANDSVNHLLKVSDWKRFFKNVARQLTPQGVFIFDVITPHFLNSFSRENGYFWELQSCFLHFSLKKRGEIFDWDVCIFEKVRGTQYQFMRDRTSERSLPHNRIEELLGLAGFSQIRCFNDEGTQDFITCDRVYFECKTAKGA